MLKAVVAPAVVADGAVEKGVEAGAFNGCAEDQIFCIPAING